MELNLVYKKHLSTMENKFLLQRGYKSTRVHAHNGQEQMARQ